MAHGTQTHNRAEAGFSDATRDRLLEAAGRVFADRGYEQATIREICMLAGVNVAAVNYHFRDKIGLYTEVLQYAMRAARIESIRSALDQDAPAEDILRIVIRLRLQGMCRGLPEWHFRIMTRELAQPTPAMEHIIDKVSRPMYKRMRELIGQAIGLPPEHEKTRLCTLSISGQIFLYAVAGPALHKIWPELKMTPDQVERIADHIADFSLAYLRQVRSKGARTGEKTPRRARKRYSQATAARKF